MATMTAAAQGAYGNLYTANLQDDGTSMDYTYDSLSTNDDTGVQFAITGRSGVTQGLIWSRLFPVVFRIAR